MAVGFSLVLHDPTTRTQHAFHMEPSPEEITTEEKHLLTLVPLPGLNVVYRESHGHDIKEVNWRGTFGLKPRPGFSPGIDRTGTELFFEFRKHVWDRYVEARGSKDPKIAQGVKLEYHDWAADLHYYCEPTRFLTPRGRDNKTFFRYDISFELYAPIQKKFKAPQAEPITEAAQASNHFKRAMEELTAAGQPLSDLSDKARNALQRNVLQPMQLYTQALDAFVSGASSVVAIPGRSLYRILDGMADFIQEAGTTLSTPLTDQVNILRNLRRTINRLAVQAPQMFKDDINTALSDMERFTFEAEDESDSAAVLADKRGGRNQLLQAYGQGVTVELYQGAKAVRVRADDTLQTLAVAHLGRVGAWREIAVLNGLQGNADLTPGDDILIPVVPGNESAGVRGDLGLDRFASSQTTEERLLGRDIQTVQDANGKLDVVFGQDNDLATVGGVANLIQAVQLKTRISQGTLLEEPEYGLRRLVGKRGHPVELVALKHRLQVAAESDPRVVEAEVRVEQTGNAVDASFALTPVGTLGRRPVSAVVERV